MIVKKELVEDLFTLIATREWKAVSKILNINKCLISQYTLTLALCYNPPLYVVQLIVDKYFDAEFEKDCDGRYPLSNAIIYGANIDVIRYLIQLNGKAIKSTDNEGKTPLHHLFDRIIQSGSPLVDDPIKEIIGVLCYYGSESILKEDMNERNVIECAIEAQVDIRIIKMIQYESICLHRRGKGS